MKMSLSQGIVYRRDGSFVLQGEEGERGLEDLLSPFENAQVTVLVCHLPPDPPQEDCWGLGSCLWEPTGRCPFGHHDSPGELFMFTHTGALRRGGAGWVVQDVPLPLSYLEGHRCQMMITQRQSQARGESRAEELREKLTRMRDKLLKFRQES